VSVREQRGGAAGLGAGALLEEQELAPGVVDARLVQVDDHLQREHEVAVEITVQRVPVTLAVPEQGGGRLALAGVVAHPQPLVQGVRPRGGAAEPGVPVAGDRHQPGVERLLEALDRLGVGGLEVAVLALAETVPAHVHR
jgi:hypothetical protein